MELYLFEQNNCGVCKVKTVNSERGRLYLNLGVSQPRRALAAGGGDVVRKKER